MKVPKLASSAYAYGISPRATVKAKPGKSLKNEVGCRDDTVPKAVDTRRHCEEE